MQTSSYSVVWIYNLLIMPSNKPPTSAYYADAMTFFIILKTMWISTFGGGILVGGVLGLWY